MNPARIIKNLRESLHIQQNLLARGILQPADLSRFEKGERDLPYAVIEALIQRLGKSCDKIEFHLSSNEYDTLFLQQLLLHSVHAKDDLFDTLCIQYDKYYISGCVLHKQFLLMVRAARTFIHTKKIDCTIDHLTTAINITFPQWKQENWGDYVLCTQEIQCLLLLSLSLLEEDLVILSEHIIDRLELIINNQITDEEEYARLYPQWCYIKLELCARDNDMIHAFHYWEDGINCIRTNGMLSLALEYLEFAIITNKNNKKFVAQRDALLLFYKNTGSEYNSCVFLQILTSNHHREIILINELIRNTRKSKNISQEELSWKICATETLSRIESGTRKPQREKRCLIYERLLLHQVPYSLMDTDNFRLLEMDRTLRRMLINKDFQEAERVLKKIDLLLDHKSVANRQYVERNRINLQVETEQLDPADAVPQLYNLLKLTYPDYKNGLYRTPTRNEFQLLLQVTNYHLLIGETDRGRKILFSLYDHYRNSAVLEDHHAREHLLLYSYLTGIHTETDDLERALTYAKDGLQLAIRCGRGDLIGIIGGNMSLTYYRKYGKKDHHFTMSLSAACQVLDFYNNQSRARQLRRFSS